MKLPTLPMSSKAGTSHMELDDDDYTCTMHVKGKAF